MQNFTLDDVRNFREGLRREIGKRIVGMDDIVEALLICLFSAPGRNCHILLEGVPGLAKTLLLKTVADATSMEMRRISFAADLLPKDIVGIEDFDKQKPEGERVQLLVRGPIFTNILLADELNRARTTSKGLILEPMEEGHVTTELGGEYALPSPFMVMATQNPVETGGVFDLGRAELDRFLMKVLVDYPSPDDEEEIIRMYGQQDVVSVTSVMDAETVLAIRETIVREIHVEPQMRKLARCIAALTRPETKDSPKIVNQYVHIKGGASPRTGIHLIRAGRVYAEICGEKALTPDHILHVALPVLRHRLALQSAEVDKDNEESALKEIVKEVRDRALVLAGVRR